LVVVTLAVPDGVQPLRFPVSKPPFTIPPPPPGDVTVRETAVEWVALAPEPVTVSVYVPAAAVPVVTVNVEPEPELTDVGLNDADAPAGTPVTDRVTVCDDPWIVAVEMLLFPVPPCWMLSDEGNALIEKSFVMLADAVKPAVAFGVPRPVGPS